MPIAEDDPTVPLSPYGWSKLMTEVILRDTAAAHPLRHVALRYFNVAGADPQLRTGLSTPGATHLIKVAVEAALGRRGRIDVFGTDYDTPDGTCIRDFIHVSDLAQAHVAALRYLRSGGDSVTLNCGYGRGYSVREVLDAVRRGAGHPFPVHFGERRPGDIVVSVAAANRIREVLGWTPQLDDLDTIVAPRAGLGTPSHGGPTRRPGPSPYRPDIQGHKSGRRFVLKKARRDGQVNGSMFTAKLKSALADRNGALALVHRLLTEQALGQWKRYAVAFALMAVAAGATALSAYLVGNVINAAYVDTNLSSASSRWRCSRGGLFFIKALASYGHTVLLAQDRQPHRRAEPDGDVQRPDHAERRVLLRPPFLRIHRPDDRRRQRREPGHQPDDHRGRPRSAVADRAPRGDGRAGSGRCRCSASSWCRRPSSCCAS